MMKETELVDDYVQHTESIAIWERKLLASQCTCHADDYDCLNATREHSHLRKQITGQPAYMS